MFHNTEPMRAVFTAQSKQFFYCRDVICAWVMECEYLPLNPFRVFDYFLSERIDRDLVRRGNNNLLRLADELWVFGIVADGVLAEIEYAVELKKPIRFFTIGTRLEEIREINIAEVKFEPEIHADGTTRDQLVRRIGGSTPISGQLRLFHPDLASCAQPLPSAPGDRHTRHAQNGAVHRVSWREEEEESSVTLLASPASNEGADSD